MTISKKVTGAIGPRSYAVEGPYGSAGNFPFPSYADGEVVVGEMGAEFIFARIAVTTAFTVNQGDWFILDNSGLAVQSQTGSGVHPFGARAVTAYFGGRVADMSGTVSVGNIWSYTFPSAGVYGMWFQQSGVSLINCATVNAQSKPLNTTAVNGQANAPSAALAGSMGITGAFSAPQTFTFVANTTTGSAILTGITLNALKGVVKGQTLSGTGIATGAVVTDIGAGTVTMSLVATATNSAQTITASNISTYVTTTSGSPVLTNVTSIAGIYPNATLTGTGIGAAGSSTVVSITGNAAPYTITMAANSSATANNINAVPSVYIEGFLMWPYIGVQN